MSDSNNSNIVMDTTNGAQSDEPIIYVDLRNQPEWKLQLMHNLIYGNLSTQEKEMIMTEHPRIAKLYLGHQSGEIKFLTSEQSNYINFPPQNSTTNKRSAENDGFKYPSPKLTARKSNVSAQAATVILNNNKFQTLKNNVNLSAPSTSTASQEQIQAQTQPPKPKIKPIQVLRTDNYREILHQLKTDNSNVNFKAANSGLFVKIQPDSADAHRTLSAYLENKQIQHYILPSGIIRPIKVVIRGLPIETTGEEIEDELKNQGFPVIKAVQLISRKTNNKMPLYQVQVQNNEKGKEIENLESLFYLSIKVEPYKSPYRVQQCRNCLFFHHHSDFCKINPRCAKCGEPHKTLECPQGQGKIENPKCANCTDGHTATYRGCAKFPKPRPNPLLNTRPVTSQFSYAQIAKSNSGNSQQPTPPITTENQNSSDLSALNSIGNSLRRIKQMLNINKLSEIAHILNLTANNMEKTTNVENRLFQFLEGVESLSTQAP